MLEQWEVGNAAVWSGLGYTDMKLGIIARCDNTGLGNQTLELVEMLNPDLILLIDSSSFHTNHRQYPERFAGRNVMVSMGIPRNQQILQFIKNVDVILSCETFYNTIFVETAKNKGKKTILQYNYEFLDYLFDERKQLPDCLVAPSVWNLEDVMGKFGQRTSVVHLPPPTNQTKFSEAAAINKNRHNRLLHVAGKAAMNDRNGTESVIEMLQYSKADYELVIKSQTPIDIDIDDDRITVDHSDTPIHSDLYSGFDAMVLPRRYAGLCLPMNEALMSGLPVFMTDVSPNNSILPQKWLAKSEKIDSFMTRTMIDLYAVDPMELAGVVDNYFNNSDMDDEKSEAYQIGYNNFSPDVLKDKYLQFIDTISK
jgi:glycosyltransferase involved in cell wall biosynthesis